MKQKIIVTNLRIPEADWLQVKAIAAEEGMSANEYVNELIKIAPMQTVARMKKMSKKRKQKKVSIYDALIKLSKMPNNPIPGDDFSSDDKAIYEGK